MKPQRKPKTTFTPEPRDKPQSQRKGALHIPLDFEQAVEGLSNVKPKKKQSKK